MILLTVDGSNAVHRAHYAVPTLSYKGTPTNAIIGFFSILLSNLYLTKATHCAVVFDMPGNNFRHDIFPAYKSTREKKPEVTKAIRQQVPIIIQMCVALGITVVAKRGIEADDIIGSLACSCEGPSYILSGDKDFAQFLVHKNIKLINPNKKIIVTHKNCKEVYGIRAKRVIDYLMLEGDDIDAIPGVPGVGAKTAIKLIEGYTSPEKIPAEAFPKAARENYKEISKQLKLNRKLVTIRPDLYDPSHMDLSIGKASQKEVAKLCKKYNLTKLATRLAKL